MNGITVYLKIYTRMFTRRLLLIGLWFIALQWPGLAIGCKTIAVVSSNSHFGIVHRIEANFHAQPQPQPPLIHIISGKIQEPANLEQIGKSCLIVAIGSEALKSVLNINTKVPILSILAHKHIFDALTLKHSNPVTAIYLDQPLERQLHLIQCLLPPEEQQPLGLLLGVHSGQIHESLQNAVVLRVNPSENPVAVLDALLDEAAVVLAIPDPHIYNPKTARGILLTAFHKRVPLIGYSRTFVKNGALAAVYSTTKQLSAQTVAMILTIINNPNKKLPPPQYPQEFSVAVNYQVAKSLGLTIDTEANLKYAIEKKELHRDA